jgi:hypothetical protein
MERQGREARGVGEGERGRERERGGGERKGRERKEGSDVGRELPFDLELGSGVAAFLV